MLLILRDTIFDGEDAQFLAGRELQERPPGAAGFIMAGRGIKRQGLTSPSD